MRRYRWPAGILLLVILLTTMFAVFRTDPPPAPSPPENAPRVVVSLGDSTLSGEGAGDYEPGTMGENGNWCHRSRAAEIHKTAIPGVDETINLACSGATSAQVGLGAAEHYTERSQAQRLGALARERRVVAVVVAVGANDDPAFGRVLDRCVEAWFERAKPGCAEDPGRQWRQRVDAMVPKVVRALDDVQETMRLAGYQPDDYQLILQSYAAPVGPAVRDGLRNLSGCPFRSEDLRWVRDTAVPVLTAGLRTAATDAGARFLDLSRSGVGHEACSGNDETTEWFRRLAVQWTDLHDDERSTHALQESFHPNATGHAQFGRCVAEFIGTRDPAAACLPGADGDLHSAASAGP